ncbi:cyclic nucleotide-binding/CBS domain-containing protein [Planctomycetes bacterium K23_9]|uniref:Arabinose 5-phosphate isomerase KdsD n=1 Tax=Stieleria marina TaxID=1930275 RepID=A0A517NST7_9BACT|nr:Arabinose 5-phosphate isomerase KdsD [Planctomycetes bacterium K23_9]
MNHDLTQSDSSTYEDPLSNYDPIDYESKLQLALAEESADVFGSQPFAQVKPTDTIRHAIQSLYESKESSLLVIDDEKLVGIFTERDVLEKVAERYPKLAEHSVSEVMTAKPTVIYETDPAAAALAAIAVAGHRHVPLIRLDNTPYSVASPRLVFEFIQTHYDA